MRNLFSDSVWTGIFLAFSLVFGEGECRAEGAKPVRGQEIVVCNWNVENLFDTEDDPENKGDDGYTPRGWMHWTENRYRLKLEHLAEIIEAMKPDILCVEEIENRRVLEDLSNQLRKQKRHPMPYIVHRESSDKRGIDCAILATQKPDSEKWLKPVNGLRDTVVATFTFHGRQLTVMGNHWKSKLGKKQESDELRAKCAHIVRRELDKLLKENPAAAILVTGDFNDEADSPAIRDVAKFSVDAEAVRNDPSGLLLYNLTATLPAGEKGTYYYAAGKKWNTLDTMAVTRGMYGGTPKAPWRVKPGSYQIFKTPAQCTKQGDPLPFRRIRRKDIGEIYSTGYSDHFPVRVILQPTTDE